MSLAHYHVNDIIPFGLLDDMMMSTRAYRQGQQVEGFRPRLDIHHNDEANTVTATFELPGMQKEDVSIDIHNNILTVSGETKESTQREEQGYTLRERRYGKFSRSMMLPQGLKNEDIKANMVNGVLNVTFPRSVPETKPAQITIH